MSSLADQLFSCSRLVYFLSRNWNRPPAVPINERRDGQGPSRDHQGNVR